jgi:sRNA-binding regulator protein Hfq
MTKQNASRLTQAEFIEKLVGRPIGLTFLDGKSPIGTLLGYDNYTLYLQVTRDNGQAEVLVYKHAVKYIATT